jgi:uncharacterized membrane protein YdjX (TVP38/TMEM64 family)
MLTADLKMTMQVIFVIKHGIYRFWKGLLAVWIGGGIGQSLAFLLARYLIGDFVSSLLRGKSRKWDVVSLISLYLYLFGIQTLTT